MISKKVISSWLQPIVIVPCLSLSIVLSLLVLNQLAVIACFSVVTSHGSI